MTPEWLSDMGLSEEDSAYLLEKWQAREEKFQQELQAANALAELPLRTAGLVPGESRDGLPETDGFICGFGA